MKSKLEVRMSHLDYHFAHIDLDIRRLLSFLGRLGLLRIARLGSKGFEVGYMENYWK